MRRCNSLSLLCRRVCTQNLLFFFLESIIRTTSSALEDEPRVSSKIFFVFRSFRKFVFMFLLQIHVVASAKSFDLAF